MVELLEKLNNMKTIKNVELDKTIQFHNLEIKRHRSAIHKLQALQHQMTELDTDDTYERKYIFAKKNFQIELDHVKIYISEHPYSTLLELSDLLSKKMGKFYGADKIRTKFMKVFKDTSEFLITKGKNSRVEISMINI